MEIQNQCSPSNEKELSLKHLEQIYFKSYHQKTELQQISAFNNHNHTNPNTLPSQSQPQNQTIENINLLNEDKTSFKTVNSKISIMSFVSHVTGIVLCCLFLSQILIIITTGLHILALFFVAVHYWEKENTFCLTKRSKFILIEIGVLSIIDLSQLFLSFQSNALYFQVLVLFLDSVLLIKLWYLLETQKRMDETFPDFELTTDDTFSLD